MGEGDSLEASRCNLAKYEKSGLNGKPTLDDAASGDTFSQATNCALALMRLAWGRKLS